MIHASYEQLKTEGWQFLALTGNYRKHHTHEEEFYRFCQIVERIRIRQMEEEYIKLQDVATTSTAAAKPAATTTGANDIPVLFDYPRTPAKDDILFTIARYLKQQIEAPTATAPAAATAHENVIVDINRGTDENTEPTSNQSNDATQKTGLGLS